MRNGNWQAWGIRVASVVGAGLLCLLTLEGILRWWDVGDPPAFDNNPLYGFLMRPNQSVSTRGYRFHINQGGLRGPDFVLPKRAGVYRIAFLGDSITYGGGSIPDPDLFVNRVVLTLTSLEGRRFEAINMSAPGWGIQNEAAYISRVGVLGADLIVWVVPSIDFRRPKTSAAENDLLTEKPKSRLSVVLLTSYQDLLSHIRSLFRSPHREDLTERAEVLEENLKVFRSTISKLEEEGTRVAVVFLPGRGGYLPNNDLANYKSVAASCSIPVLDSAPGLPGQSSAEAFIDAIHLNRRGHALLAEQITKFLKNNFLDAESEKVEREGCSGRPVPH
jgi:GDSL-like Lipase/Acylhydrolase